uniref:Uncharacterized protein n=1 Tax=Glossina palpalis gambiensis TaxID=67801 RepID=A0A1B0BUA9_9MUSC
MKGLIRDNSKRSLKWKSGNLYEEFKKRLDLFNEALAFSLERQGDNRSVPSSSLYDKFKRRLYAANALPPDDDGDELGHVTIAKLLVDSKATIDLQDEDGETAFIGPLRELPELIVLDIATAVAKILSSLDIFSSSTKPNSDGFIMNPFVVAHLKKFDASKEISKLDMVRPPESSVEWSAKTIFYNYPSCPISY